MNHHLKSLQYIGEPFHVKKIIDYRYKQNQHVRRFSKDYRVATLLKLYQTFQESPHRI